MNKMDDNRSMNLFVLLLAVFGGIARYLNGYLKGQKFNLWKLLASAVVSGFTGYTAGQLMMQIKPGYASAAAGIVGFMGGEAMTYLTSVLAARAGIEKPEMVEALAPTDGDDQEKPAA